MDLSIIIVNWNSAKCLRSCLESVYKGAAGMVLEVIVVDNASFDGSEEVVRAHFPDARYVQSKENLGFAGGSNLGFSHSVGRNLLFLNPDTEIVGSALRDMLATLESLPIAGIVGPTLLNSDHSVQTSCIKAFPTILNQALDAEYLRRAFPRSRLWGMRPLFERDGHASSVDVVSGACLMVKREVFQRVGLFNTDYFMYGEDVDLCFKVKRAGRKIYHVSNATVIHHGGGSSAFQPDSSFENVGLRESGLKFMRLRRGKLYAFVYRLTIVLAATLRLCLLGLLLALTAGRIRRPSLQIARDKWTKILRWALSFQA